MIKKALHLIIVNILLVYVNLYSQELTPEEIFEKVNNNVYIIISYDINGKPVKQGSGVALSRDGLFVTNYHVFSECSYINIEHNNTKFKDVEIFNYDISKDILILKANSSNIYPIMIGDSDMLKVGQKIYTIGSPLGLENSMSEGIISGFRNFNERDVKYIQITASISPGSSGGAVVNTKGELIGISNMTISEGQNINFAIPVSEILSLANIQREITYEKDENIENNEEVVIEDNEAITDFKQKELKKSETLLINSLKKDRKNAEKWYKLGVCQIELEKYIEANKSFRNCQNLTNDFDDVIFDYWLSKYKMSVEFFNDAVGKDSVTTYFNLNESIRYAKAAAGIIPDSLESYRIIGDAYYYMQKYDQAIYNFSLIYNRTKNEVDAINLAKAYYKNGLIKRLKNQYVKSILVFKKVLKLEYLPKDNIYYESSFFNIGICYYQEALGISTLEGGDYKPKLRESVKYFELLKTSKNKDLLRDLYEYLYNSYIALGDIEKANEIMRLKSKL